MHHSANAFKVLVCWGRIGLLWNRDACVLAFVVVGDGTGLTFLVHPFLSEPRQRGQIKAGPKEGTNATSPLHSRGSPTKGTNQSGPKGGRKCYITPAFSGIPKQMGTKSKRAQKRAEMLHHPCILGDPQTTGDKIRIDCLNPAFWRAQQVGQNTRSTSLSRGSPTKGQNQSTK